MLPLALRAAVLKVFEAEENDSRINADSMEWREGSDGSYRTL
jgi:hypothetical protein